MPTTTTPNAHEETARLRKAVAIEHALTARFDTAAALEILDLALASPLARGFVAELAEVNTPSEATLAQAHVLIRDRAQRRDRADALLAKRLGQ